MPISKANNIGIIFIHLSKIHKMSIFNGMATMKISNKYFTPKRINLLSQNNIFFMLDVEKVPLERTYTKHIKIMKDTNYLSQTVIIVNKW